MISPVRSRDLYEIPAMRIVTLLNMPFDSAVQVGAGQDMLCHLLVVCSLYYFFVINIRSNDKNCRHVSIGFFSTRTVSQVSVILIAVRSGRRKT